MKEGAAPGNGDKMGHGYRPKDDNIMDVDTTASEFIMRRHRAWALQKSTTIDQLRKAAPTKTYWTRKPQELQVEES
ncbi:hypothetical protein U9M48_016359 [Paspalum notatum var. saurae]|uniref:Uncharacterized protein n=1 Tax=Paspalum notatum var. saurae TaxID=547442 RepID=A0AAQ3T8J6_PASNO